MRCVYFTMKFEFYYDKDFSLKTPNLSYGSLLLRVKYEMNKFPQSLLIT